MLEELAGLAAEDRADAVRTSSALAVLLEEAQDWRIPDAVTAPIDAGQVAEAMAIVEDARAVVVAARAADDSLPEANLGADIRPRFEAVATGAEMAALRTEAETKRAQAEAVGGALEALSNRVPDWRIPAVVTTPIAERDFVSAAAVAGEAQKWVENAWEADQKLGQMGAITRVKPLFEGAQTLADLEAGAELAESWNLAAGNVRNAVDAVAAPRDLMTNLGLWGTDVQPSVNAAIDAAVAGDVSQALSWSAAVIETINNGSSVGGLRLAGVVFFGVALAGIIGMWLVFRRQAGPRWARQTKPHWIASNRPRLGSGRVSNGADKGKKR
jgi:hypothetical protein